MLFEQHHSEDLLTPSINDGGVHKLNSSLTSLDFYLLDDIEAYLSPIQSKTHKNDLINDSIDDHSQHHEDPLADFDLSEFDEKSDFINSMNFDDLDLEKWITQSSFPSPPMDSNVSFEDTLTTTFDEYPINTDMVVPPSPPLSSISSSPAPPLSSISSSPAPPLSSISSSPAPSIKKTKLSTTERKQRKKCQNKTAAEKYRIRKKSERHHLLDRHTLVKNTNRELKLELENLTFRVEKFKQLFVDLLQIDPSTGN